MDAALSRGGEGNPGLFYSLRKRGEGEGRGRCVTAEQTALREVGSPGLRSGQEF